MGVDALDAWMERARQAQREGKRVEMGASCPDCHKPIPLTLPSRPQPNLCSCGQVLTRDELHAAHGVDEIAHLLVDIHHPEVG